MSEANDKAFREAVAANVELTKKLIAQIDINAVGMTGDELSAHPDAKKGGGSGCFGTAGTYGTLGGCFGTAGTYGCFSKDLVEVKEPAEPVEDPAKHKKHP